MCLRNEAWDFFTIDIGQSSVKATCSFILPVSSIMWRDFFSEPWLTPQWEIGLSLTWLVRGVWPGCDCFALVSQFGLLECLAMTK